MKFELEKLIRKNILSLQPYASARNEYKGTEGIFLDANENPYGSFNRYPDPYQKDLKDVIAMIKQVNAQQIFIGNGSDEIIDIAFRIFCNPAVDKALTFTPTYGMYQVAADINDVELITLPLDTAFQINLSTLQPYLNDEHLKLIFICSPNNPTGNLIDTKSIEYILQHFNGMVIIDEAYIDFAEQASFVSKIKNYPNLIVSQTLSKAYGLAGLRLGLAFMDTAVLSYFNKVKPPYNVSVLNQKMALEELGNTQEYSIRLASILKEKTVLMSALTTIDFVKKIYPTDANFILIEVNNANTLYQQLTQKQIIVRNRDSVLKNCLRITIGTAFENQQLINELKALDK